MGGNTSRTTHKKHSYGALAISVENNDCLPGQEVTGVIYLYLTSPIPACSLFLKFTGKEKTAWTETRTETETDSEGNTKSTTVTDHYNGCVRTCNQFCPLRAWPDGLSAGQYTLPFIYTLPSNITGSFYYKRFDTLASIHYLLGGVVISEKTCVLKKSIRIWIQKPPVSVGFEYSLERSTRIKKCCSNKGVCKMKINYPQECYSPSKPAVFNVEIDNSQSQVPVIGLILTLYYLVRIKNNYGRHNLARGIAYSGRMEVFVPPGNRLLGKSEKEIVLNLPYAMRELSQISSVKSNLIECMFTVSITANLQGSCLCSDDPYVESLITMVPNAIEKPSVPVAPEDWNPTVYAPSRVSFDSKYEVDKK